jgi:hypothetical protein
MEGAVPVSFEYRTDGHALAVSTDHRPRDVAVPLILAELRRETDHWFWALEAITGENPVPNEVAGDVEATAAAWLRWGREKGFDV